MSIISSNDISENIRFFARDERRIVSFARNHEFPMPPWSCFTLIERVTGIFSTFLLDKPYSKSMLFDVKKDFFWNNSKHCWCFANAIFAQNMFNQKYVKNIDSYKDLLTSLKDDEPGIFHIATRGSHGNTKGDFEYVPAHAIILLKYFEDNSWKFRVVQIFEGNYSLSEFLEKYENHFKYINLEDLQANFLQPLESIFSFGDQWGDKEETAYEQLTRVRLDLTGIPVSDNKSLNRWQIKRTTNIGLPSRSSLVHAVGTLFIIFSIIKIINSYKFF